MNTVITRARLGVAAAALATAFIATPASACQLVCLLAPSTAPGATNDEKCNNTYKGFKFAKPGVLANLPGDTSIFAGSDGGPYCASYAGEQKKAIDYVFARLTHSGGFNFFSSTADISKGGMPGPSYITSFYPSSSLPSWDGGSACPGAGTGQILCCNI